MQTTQVTAKILNISFNFIVYLIKSFVERQTDKPKIQTPSLMDTITQNSLRRCCTNFKGAKKFLSKNIILQFKKYLCRQIFQLFYNANFLSFFNIKKEEEIRITENLSAFFLPHSRMRNIQKKKEKSLRIS